MPALLLFFLQRYLDAPSAHVWRAKRKGWACPVSFCSLRDGGWSPRFFQGARKIDRERECVCVYVWWPPAYLLPNKDGYGHIHSFYCSARSLGDASLLRKRRCDGHMHPFSQGERVMANCIVFMRHQGMGEWHLHSSSKERVGRMGTSNLHSVP